MTIRKCGGASKIVPVDISIEGVPVMLSTFLCMLFVVSWIC